MTEVRADVSPGPDESVTGTVIDAGPAYPGADVNRRVFGSTTGSDWSDRTAVTPSGSAMVASRPGATCTCSPSGMTSVSPEATRSSGALGRGVGGKKPRAGTVMNAYDGGGAGGRRGVGEQVRHRLGVVDEGHDDVAPLGHPRHVRLRPGHRHPQVAQRAAGVLRDREDVDRDLRAPERVQRGDDDVAGDRRQHRGVVVDRHGEHRRVPPAALVGGRVRDLEDRRGVGRLDDDPAALRPRAPVSAGSRSRSSDSSPPLESTSLASTRTSTRWPGRTVTASSRATTGAAPVGRGLMPTRTVATARCPTQSSTA